MMQRYALYCFLLLYPFITKATPRYRPIEFVKNMGQWEEPYLYKAYAGNTDIFLEQHGFTYVVGSPDNIEKIRKFKTGALKLPFALDYHCYKVSFVGANKAEVSGSKDQEHYYNYFIGNDSSRWKTGIHPNLAVDYLGLYNNIDLHIASEEQSVKYDLILQPGADPDVIALEYEGVEDMRIKNNSLIVGLSVGEITEMKPYAYQYIDGRRVEVECKYRLKKNTVSFSFPNGYDKTKTLVIDPTIVFATFTGSSFDNWGYTATYDVNGAFYAGGITSPNAGGSGYVTTPGAYQTVYGGPNTGGGGNGYPCDMGITKFNSAGTSIIYSTYIGGSNNEQPHSLIVDPSGNLIIAGRTYSGNFPTSNDAYDKSYNGGGDLVVLKLNASGTSLLGSTFIGGGGEDVTNNTAAEFGWGGLKHNYGDDARSEVNIDNQGNIYVAGNTRSGDFPTTSQAIKKTLTTGDTQDGVIVKLNSNLTNLIWSTYLGGSNEDAVYVLTFDTTQTKLYVAGGTMSNTDFPSPFSGTYHSSYQGGTADGFICRFQNGGNYPLERTTFIGTNNYDQCFGIQVDDENSVYVMGQTLGGNFPVTAGVYSNPKSSQFVMKLDAELTTNLISTVFGSGNSSATNISPVAFLVDTCQNIYISGWGGDIYSPANTPPPGTGNTNGMPLSSAPNPPAQSSTDGQDFYFIVLSKNMLSLLYATYQGTNGGVCEHVDGGTSRFDKHGVVYQAICGGCGGGTFPTTPSAVHKTNGSNNCNLVALKIAFNLGAVNATAKALPNAVVCLGDPVNFQNNSANAVSYEWDFGDASPISTLFQPSHTYTQTGVYQVRMIAYNPNACKVRDTAYLTITVDTNAIDARFDAIVTDSCDPYIVSLNNTSKYGTNPGNTSFVWDFGDGNTATGANPGTHTYSKPGTYTIILTMTDPDACNSPDSITKTISFNPLNVAASFQLDDVCFGDTVALLNTSTNGQTYFWKIGDRDTSIAYSPIYYFDSIGTYTVKLYAYNPAACNKVDSVEKTVKVNPSPTSNFIFSPTEQDIETNDSLHFTNRSENASLYNWNFGDGLGSQLTNPVHFYKKTGYYTVCLYASNKEGCTDTLCKKVYADVRPLADLPNAFSPNGDGKNDILYVRGAAIESIDLKIFNRWGEMVFHTTDKDKGWDGKYNGKPQEMDAYAYVLSVLFIDETTFQKQGNVTLLR